MSIRISNCLAAFLLWMGISHGWFLQLLSCCCKMLLNAGKKRRHEEGAPVPHLSHSTFSDNHTLGMPGETI